MQAARRYFKSFASGFVVAVPVTVTFLDYVGYVARVEGASMQPFLNPEDRSFNDVVLLNRWSVRNFKVNRGDVVSLASPRDPEQRIIKRVIALEGDTVRHTFKMPGTRTYKNRYVRVPSGHFWVEGDNFGHSLDSNFFGPVSVGLVHARASHILWPPQRWQRIEPSLPTDRRPLDQETIDHLEEQGAVTVPKT
ncbi:IMMP2L [Branchiostoma lanceolatum]|nr:IMMP2L [Branchiostoma lanceolatum]